MLLSARLLRASSNAAKRIAQRATQDGDPEAARIWESRSKRWSIAAEKKGKIFRAPRSDEEQEK
jgi:hypothetical protein